MATARSAKPARVRRPSIWACVLVLLAAAPVLVHAAGKKPKKTNGPYSITVGGSYHGGGTALVVPGAVTITLRVRDDSGTEGQLVAADLLLSGAHFRGRGLVFGRPATFTGRLDGYADDRHFRGARLLCSFVEDAGGGAGRVAGVLR